MLETTPVCIRLERAYLCLDCEHIQEDTRFCRNCGSRAVYNLAKFINRTTEPVV